MDETRIDSIARALAVAGVPVVGAARETAARKDPLRDVKVTGRAKRGGAFEGTFDIDRFAAKGKKPVASGTLTGTLEDEDGGSATSRSASSSRSGCRAGSAPARARSGRRRRPATC